MRDVFCQAMRRDRRVKFIPHKRFSNSFDPKVSIYKVSALVSALEFGDYRSLYQVGVRKTSGWGRSHDPAPFQLSPRDVTDSPSENWNLQIGSFMKPNPNTLSCDLKDGRDVR